MKKKMLVLVPPLTGRRGGISNLYKTLEPHLNSDADFFYINRKEQVNSAVKVLMLFTDLFRFFFVLLFKRYQSIVLNPPLRPIPVTRDAVYLFMCRLFLKKTVVFWHGWDFNFQDKIERKYLFLFRFFYFYSSSMFVLSQKYSDTLRRWGYKKKITIVTTVADDQYIDLTRKVFDVPPLRVLFLGRIQRMKGIFIALEAVSILQKEYGTAVSLVIAGGGTDGEPEEAERYVKENNLRDVQFVGFLSGEEKINAFRNAHVFILPSYDEGMPCALVEALAFGLVPVTSGVGGIPDLVVDGVNGFILDSFDARDYADKIGYLAQNPDLLETISTNNQTYANDRLSASNLASLLKCECC